MKVGDKIYKDPNAKKYVKELISDDTHLARIYGVIEQGVQETGYKDDQGNPKKVKKVMILYEISDDLVKNGDKAGMPKVKNQSFSYGATDRSHFRTILLKAVEGRLLTEAETKSYPVASLIGKPLKIDIIHEKSPKDPTIIYDNIAGLSRIGKSDVVPGLVHEPVLLDLDDFDVEEYKKVPKWMKDKGMINLDSVPGIDKILADLEVENQAKDDDRSDAIKRAQNV